MEFKALLQLIRYEMLLHAVRPFYSITKRRKKIKKLFLAGRSAINYITKKTAYEINI